MAGKRKWNGFYYEKKSAKKPKTRASSLRNKTIEDKSEEPSSYEAKQLAFQKFQKRREFSGMSFQEQGVYSLRKLTGQGSDQRKKLCKLTIIRPGTEPVTTTTDLAMRVSFGDLRNFIQQIVSPDMFQVYVDGKEVLGMDHAEWDAFHPHVITVRVLEV